MLIEGFCVFFLLFLHFSDEIGANINTTFLCFLIKIVNFICRAKPRSGNEPTRKGYSR